MNVEKIKWCLCQTKGIKLIEPKPHLAKSYIEDADETLENVFSAKGKWRTITAYYSCYSALYSILMKCGIKSEIHECTLELMDLFEFTKDEIEFMRILKEDRIQSQYYLKNIILDDEEPVKRFILKCKVILGALNTKTIEEIRKRIKEK
ncbi:hypothetical protein JXA85_03135 [Candidatus Woesearchaeota archaeon]|nr:hypothetical protein [Candidatus Woesearchaeota archaeon]